LRFFTTDEGIPSPYPVSIAQKDPEYPSRSIIAPAAITSPPSVFPAQLGRSAQPTGQGQRKPAGAGAGLLLKMASPSEGAVSAGACWSAAAAGRGSSVGRGMGVLRHGSSPSMVDCMYCNSITDILLYCLPYAVLSSCPPVLHIQLCAPSCTTHSATRLPHTTPERSYMSVDRLSVVSHGVLEGPAHGISNPLAGSAAEGIGGDGAGWTRRNATQRNATQRNATHPGRRVVGGCTVSNHPSYVPGQSGVPVLLSYTTTTGRSKWKPSRE
jgi:hypothetical protein